MIVRGFVRLQKVRRERVEKCLITIVSSSAKLICINPCKETSVQVVKRRGYK